MVNAFTTQSGESIDISHIHVKVLELLVTFVIPNAQKIPMYDKEGKVKFIRTGT